MRHQAHIGSLRPVELGGRLPPVSKLVEAAREGRGETGPTQGREGLTTPPRALGRIAGPLGFSEGHGEAARVHGGGPGQMEADFIDRNGGRRASHSPPTGPWSLGYPGPPTAARRSPGRAVRSGPSNRTQPFDLQVFTATLPTLRAFAALCLLAAVASGQTVSLLNDLSGPRGLTTRGEGGLHGILIEGFVQPVTSAVGRSVAILDANQDGYDDLLIGAPLMPTDPLDPALVTNPFPAPDEAGHAYLIFGSAEKGTPGSDAEIDLRNLGPGEGIDFIGPPGSHTGTAVAAVGFINNDAFPDFVIGAPLRSEGGLNLNGGAYLVLGGATIGNGSHQQFLENLRATTAGTFLRGNRSMAMVGSALGGGIDADGDGSDDIILGAPFDSSDGLLQNGSAWIAYGFNSMANVSTRILNGALPGGLTEVRGSDNFQLLGTSVAGIGRFDPVLPGQAGATSLIGDEFAIGAPSASLNGKLLSGAVAVLRGVELPATPAALLTLDDFGDGPDDAGPVFTGGAQGDRAGHFVGPAGDFFEEGGGADIYDDLIITAPLNGDLGRPQRGATYVISGAFDSAAPAGYDLSLAGTPARPLSLEILGQATGEGVLGVFAVPGGDWNSDGIDELLLGTPSSAHLDINFVTFPEAGRLRVLDGGVLSGLHGSTVNLDFPPPGVFQLQFSGEAAGFHAGTTVAAGDLNNDGDPDLATGAPGAASRPSAEPFGSVAWRETGRAHAVYGPIFRLGNVAPTDVFFGGPDVEMEVFNLVEPFTVEVDGLTVEIVDSMSGSTGSITFRVPPPPGAPPFGPLSDLTLTTPLGTQTFDNFIQFVETEITEPPEPDRGLPGQTIAVRGIAFNDVEEFGVRDTEVFIDGVPMTVQSVVFDDPEEGGDGDPDVLTATITVLLEKGPQLNELVDIEVRNSNGSDVLENAFTYKTIMVTGVEPATGPAESGIFDEDQTGPPPFMGEEAIDVEVTIDSSIIPPVDLVFEFGNDEQGFEVVPASLDENVFTFTLPSNLKGPVETLMDLRVTDSTGTDTLVDGFTYAESDFEQRDDYDESLSYAGTGFGPLPPRLRMSGELSPGCDVLVLADRFAPETTAAGLFISLEEFDPPLELRGGSFGPDVTGLHFLIIFPTPAPQFSLPFRVNPDPSGLTGDEVIFMQLYTEEEDAGIIRIGLSNLLVGFVDLSPEKCEPAPPPPGY